jgi:hypothetical protein
MANRQMTRRIAISAVIAICLVFFLFINPQGPPSPAVRAPGHIAHGAAPGSGITIQEDTLKGAVVMPKLGNATAKAELGRATWKYFHTVMARFPEKPTEDQQEALRSYIFLFARLYPWYGIRSRPFPPPEFTGVFRDFLPAQRTMKLTIKQRRMRRTFPTTLEQVPAAGIIAQIRGRMGLLHSQRGQCDVGETGIRLHEFRRIL